MEHVFGFEALPAPFEVTHLQIGLLLRSLLATGRLYHARDGGAGVERDNLNLMAAGQGVARPIAGSDEARRWATTRGLLADQLAVAEFTLAATDWLTAIEGRAGSAKTTTVSAIAVRNLERAGVPRSAAMKLTGHKTEAVYRRYAITDAAMLQEAAAKLAALHAAEANSHKLVINEAGS